MLSLSARSDLKLWQWMSVGPITMERRHIGVKLPILGEINKEAGSPIGLYAILYTFLLYLELLILMYIKSSSCSQEEQLRQVNTRNSTTYLTHQVRH